MTRPVALVTGASRGIGRAIALELAKRGHAVGVNFRQNEAQAAETVEALRALGVEARALRADVSSAPEVAEMFRRLEETLGEPSVLVCNAGITRDTLLGASEPADFDS